MSVQRVIDDEKERRRIMGVSITQRVWDRSHGQTFVSLQMLLPPGRVKKKNSQPNLISSDSPVIVLVKENFPTRKSNGITFSSSH